ncbi:MAG TPA: GNAT family N-acetyltransferase [Allosphingosinicella sp.]|nr:GNAT family N-acetyltransferase [Allosphingosinicella sp.]
MEAPTLETERLRLRAFRSSDLDAQAATMGDPEVVRHLGGHPFSREETWRKLLCAPGLWVLLGFGYWAVERKEDGAYCGQLGFADFKRDLKPSIEGTPEMGWIFAPQMHGQGYASEACVGALEWLDGALPGREATAIISHANIASIRVAEKNGFSVREEALYRGEPILLFRRPPPVR